MDVGASAAGAGNFADEVGAAVTEDGAEGAELVAGVGQGVAGVVGAGEVGEAFGGVQVIGVEAEVLGEGLVEPGEAGACGNVGDSWGGEGGEGCGVAVF